MDVFVDDTKVDALSGAEFGDLTGYVKVPAGTYAIKVCATADSTVCPIGPVDLTFDAGDPYTVAASDLLAQIKAARLRRRQGDATGSHALRVVHLSADTPGGRRADPGRVRDRRRGRSRTRTRRATSTSSPAAPTT